MNIRTAGTGLGVACSIGAGAIMVMFPNQQLAAGIVLASSILLAIVCGGWWLIAKRYAFWTEDRRIAVLMASGIFIGLYVGAVVYFAAPLSTFQYTDDSKLFLKFSDSHTAPTEIENKNVSYWYAVWTPSIYVDTLDKDKKSLGGFSIPPHWNVFIIFERRAKFRQLLADCPGPNNPKCNVITASSIYAVVAIEGDVSFAVLDIHSKN